MLFMDFWNRMFQLSKLEDSSYELTAGSISGGLTTEMLWRYEIIYTLVPAVSREVKRFGEWSNLVKSLLSRKQGHKALNMESQRGFRKGQCAVLRQPESASYV